MSAETRKAETAALLARIEEVVSGHDQQRTTEAVPGDALGPLELRAASFAQQLQPLVDEFSAVMRRMSRAVGLTGDAFTQLLRQMAETGKLPPVPAKAAHRRKFSRN